MAITVTAIASSSPTVFSSTLPLLKNQTQQTASSSSSSSSSFSKLGLSLISNESSPHTPITAATEAVTLATAAVQAAREAAQLVSESGELSSENERGGFGDLIARRKKRRERRIGLDFMEMEEVKKGKKEETLFHSSRNGYLSPTEEAEFCLCLKDQAKLEAARRRIAETQEHEPTLKQLAKALRMRRRNVGKIQCKGKESRKRITHNYKRLVVSIAKSYQGKGLSLQDLIQEGSIGLLRGAERFDPSRGNKLSTYAYWWIKEAIFTSISNKSKIVRIPCSMWGKMTKVAEARIALQEKLGRLPSYDEIAEVLNFHISTVRIGFERSKPPVSLDRVICDQGSMTLQEIMPGPEEMLPENMVKRQLMKQELDKILHTLDEREEYVVRLTFGLDGKTPQSFEEIGGSLKLSRERIRQINSMALSKLRQRSILENLEVYIL